MITMIFIKNKNNLNISPRKILLLTSAFLFLFFLSPPPNIHADSAEDEVESAEEEIETLEQKAANYQRMINLKKQEQMSLENQLQMMDIQIDNFQNDVELTKQDIERNTEEVKEVERRIGQKEDELNNAREDLGEMLRLYHQIDQELGMELLSTGGDFSTVLNQSEYIDQTSQNVDAILEELEGKKVELEERKGEYKEKNKQLDGRKKDLQEKISYTNTEKLSKNILLEKTHGEEAKYKVLLDRVEQQKEELIGDLDSLSGETRGEISKILASSSKPKSGTASESWYYAQDDKKWANKRIGLSSSLMKDWGCAVTALAMVFTYHDEDITPGKLSGQPIFYRDLIVWPQHWKSLDLNSSTSHGNINWSEVKKQIKKDRPVVVFVKAYGGKGHYVVIHGMDKKGRYVVHDPLFGPNIYLETTKKLVGAIYGTSTTIDQMLIYKD